MACYCAQLRPFDPGFDLAVLVHPREHRNPVGTARMLHRFTQGSRVFVGTGRELADDESFRSWLGSRTGATWVLYPDDQAEWVDTGPSAALRRPSRPAIVLLDGTWSQAKGLMRDCSLLHALPRVAFHPQMPSQYGFREQPADLCLSSLEAVVELCRRLGSAKEENLAPMLAAFLSMVDFQLESERTHS